jgi:hypothetical protein
VLAGAIRDPGHPAGGRGRGGAPARLLGGAKVVVMARDVAGERRMFGARYKG